MPKGISLVSRSQAYQKRALFKHPNPAQTQPSKVAVKGKHGKQTRKTLAPIALRKSITPGTVLILLAGRYRGKRVVFLSQLASGLLLVTGPHCINGVALRRVNQAYVIATQTSVDISGLEFPDFADADFAKPARSQQEKTAHALLDPVDKQPLQRRDLQKQVDALLMPRVKKTPLLKQYLNSSFALSKGQYPHEIKF